MLSFEVVFERLVRLLIPARLLQSSIPALECVNATQFSNLLVELRIYRVTGLRLFTLG